MSTGDDTLTLISARFSELPGWKADAHANALTAFLASCEKLARLPEQARVGTGPFGGYALDWRPACLGAGQVPPGNHRKARAFFEREFRVYATRGDAGPTGRITGYYVQPLRASRRQGGEYQFPLYRRPADLVSISLSDFISDGRSRRAWGRLSAKGTRLVHYPTRAAYRKAFGSDTSNVLLWLDNPRDVVRVEIEGSGRATMDDGTTVMVGFAGKNARKSGKLRLVSRQLQTFLEQHRRRGSRQWANAEIARYHQIVDQKTSVVFFAMESRPGAIGSQNVVLTPRRSLAVDRATISLSTPVWVATRAPQAATGPSKRFRHLLIAQDTGGAIRGTMRGDIYWGDDATAMAIGKRVNGPGRMWLLLPRGLKVRAQAR